jgi:hypothetical protein
LTKLTSEGRDQFLYQTERWDAAWNPREMGSAWVGRVREGKISSQLPAEVETTASWSGNKAARGLGETKRTPS